ncbi:MAG TPA: indole-3-glycerol phosphate synthase TrpC [Actinomycetota bacterium]|nr:indole-3-glycerol phosphate synthase TrpC [Actinomycetota bacterium]
MSYLDDLLRSTRNRIEEARSKLTDTALEQRVASAPSPRDLRAALSGEGISVIAEIKRATPRAGDLDLGLDAGRVAAAYRDGGAAAISVLTEPDFFKGSLEDMAAARGAGLPVMRKDFILDPFQVYEARAFGADAVLLIVRILGDELSDLVALTLALKMAPLVEVHTEGDLERALAAGADLIGVNHRDLDTFEIDPDRTAKLAPLVPDGTILVGLSGVSTRDEMQELEQAGAHAALVGESLVTSSDPAAKLRELLGR